MKQIEVAVFVLALPIVSLFGTGCASIVKGTTQTIPVASTPSGASVRLDGNLVGQTPTSVEVKRKGDHLLTVELPGYQTESVAVTRNIGGAVFGNIIAGGLVGWGVDAMTGAQWNLSPVTVNIALRPVAAGQQGTAVADNTAAVLIRELQALEAKHSAKQLSDEDYMKQRTALMEKYSSQGSPPEPSTPAEVPTATATISGQKT